MAPALAGGGAGDAVSEENPYPWWTPSHWCWHVRQPSNPSHRLFWAVGYESQLPDYRIVWLGVVTLWWDYGRGWSRSWNFD